MNSPTFFQQLSAYWHRPHYWDGRAGSLFQQSLAFGLAVFCLLWLFQPFGFNRLDTMPLFWLCLELGALTSLSIAASLLLLSRLFPGWFSEDRWTIGREVKLAAGISILIGLLNGLLFFAHGMMGGPMLPALLKICYNTVLIGLPPVILFVIWDQNKLLRRRLQEAEAYSRQLRERRPPPPEQDTPVVLTDEKGRPALQLYPRQLLYLQAAGNYTEVYFLDEARQEQRELIRNRLKAVSELLPEAQLLQCHRSYRVNRQRIRQVVGNARNYELILEGAAQPVPVARGKAASVMQLLVG